MCLVCMFLLAINQDLLFMRLVATWLVCSRLPCLDVFTMSTSHIWTWDHCWLFGFPISFPLWGYASSGVFCSTEILMLSVLSSAICFFLVNHCVVFREPWLSQITLDLSPLGIELIPTMSMSLWNSFYHLFIHSYKIIFHVWLGIISIFIFSTWPPRK